MAEALRCPNCQAPLKVEADQPLVVCTYCGHQIKQTVAMPSAGPRRVDFSPEALMRQGIDVAQLRRRGRRAVLIGVLVTTLLPILVVVVVGVNVRRCTTTGRQLKQLGVPTSDPEPDQQLAAKLGAYSQCLKDYSGQALSSKDRYLGWNDEREASCSERCASWGVHKVTIHNSQCEDGIKLAREAPPRIPGLEQAGDALLAALRQLATLTEQVNRYYDQKDYKDDGCAKGKQLHGPLVAAFGSFERADAAVRAVVDKEMLALLERRVQREGQRTPGGIMGAYFKLFLDARKLLDLCRTMQEKRSDSDLTAARALVAAIDQDITAAVEAERRTPGAGKMDYFLWPYTFENHIKDGGLELVKRAKEHLRKLAAGGPRSLDGVRRIGTYTHYSRHEDSFAQVVGGYNDLLRYAKGVGPTMRLPPDLSRCQ